MGTEEQYKRLLEVLLPWYRENARDLPWRKNREPYRVWISEIMLQQTRVEAVKGYYERFIKVLPDIDALAVAEESRLFKLWEGLGYYSRVRNLQKAAREIVNQRAGRFPDTYEEILSLPGIGPYTAGAIGSICFDLPTAAVDGNVLRIISRITANSAPIDLAKTKKEIGCNLQNVYPKQECGLFTQSLMELGAMVCIPRSPKCEVCPAKEFCLAKRQNAVLAYPVKSPKKEKRVEDHTVFLLQYAEEIALTKREETGLLSGMWQLPNVLGALDVVSAQAAAERFGVKPTGVIKEIHKTHIFTHIKWNMVCFHLQCAKKSEAFTWASAEKIRAEYALPTAFKMFFDEL